MTTEELLKTNADRIGLTNWVTQKTVCWNGMEWEVQQAIVQPRSNLTSVSLLLKTNDFEKALSEIK